MLSLDDDVELDETDEETDEKPTGRTRRPKPEDQIEKPNKRDTTFWLVDPVNHGFLFSKPAPEGLGGPINDIIVAASIGLAVLKEAKVAKWSDLPDATIPATIKLTVNDYDPDDRERAGGHGSSQLRSLEQASWVLGVLRSPVRASKGDPDAGAKGARFTVCTECGRWLLASTAPASKKCSFTDRCEGTPYTVPPAIASGFTPWTYKPKNG